MTQLNATFEIDLRPAEPLVPGSGRFDFTKQWRGDLIGTSTGVMLSGGDPTRGSAGYVALEVFTGIVGGRSGSVSLQQFGTMAAGAEDLRYEIVPGSGTEELAGITGIVQLEVSEGNHLVTVDAVWPEKPAS